MNEYAQVFRDLADQIEAMSTEDQNRVLASWAITGNVLQPGEDYVGILPKDLRQVLALRHKLKTAGGDESLAQLLYIQLTCGVYRHFPSLAKYEKGEVRSGWKVVGCKPKARQQARPSVSGPRRPKRTEDQGRHMLPGQFGLLGKPETE